MDNGQNWNVYTGYSNDTLLSFDKEMIACDDGLNSPYKDNLYCAWTKFNLDSTESVMFNRSTDGGSSFSQPIVLENGFGHGTNIQTGPNGIVYICWANNGTGSPPPNGIGFTKSVDGGASFSPYIVAFPYSGFKYTPDSAFNYIGINGFPSMAVDKSKGPHRGRIYIAYPTKENGNGKAIIQVRYSDDEGTTWSNPNTVSIPNGRQNFFPWIAVDDSTGAICVDYYSFDSPSGWSTNTYMAYSRCGNVWYNMRVSDVSHITAPIVGQGIRTGYAGDYIGIAAYGGKAYPAWMDDRNGTWQIYVSPVHFNFILASISGDSTVCTSGSTFTLNNPPPNTSITWTHSSDLTYVSGQGTDRYTVKAASSSISGMGWVDAILSSGCGNDTIKKGVWVGIPSFNLTGDTRVSVNMFGLAQIAYANTVIQGSVDWTRDGAILTVTGGPIIGKFRAGSRPGYGDVYATVTNTCGSTQHRLLVQVTSLYSVYPNPATSQVTINIDENNLSAQDKQKGIDVQLYDKQMNLKKHKIFRGKKTTLNLTGLPSDVYILHLMIGDSTYSKKIIKE